MRARARVRQHVNPLNSGYDHFRGQEPRLIPGVEVELEIGCAEAQFLFERAEQDPTRVYIGLEIREELVHWVNAEAQERGLPVQAVFCHAQNHMADIFPASSVDRVYLNFPDPWFKKRHHKRRMIDAVLVAGIAEITKPGAAVFVQTDVWDIALDAMDVLERADDAFVNVEEPWRFWRRGNPYGVRSWREQHCEEDGLPIWRIMYRRR